MKQKPAKRPASSERIIRDISPPLWPGNIRFKPKISYCCERCMHSIQENAASSSSRNRFLSKGIYLNLVPKYWDLT